jgi:hypothetical protein
MLRSLALDKRTLRASSAAFGVELQMRRLPDGTTFRERTGPIYVPAELQPVVTDRHSPPIDIGEVQVRDGTHSSSLAASVVTIAIAPGGSKHLVCVSHLVEVRLGLAARIDPKRRLS